MLKSQLQLDLLQAIHSNLFHQRKQEEGEAVNQYVQELRKLFYKAYPKANQATARGFGKSVLAYQFVAGLIPVLRLKVTGVEGNFDQLLVKARFEEAKLRGLTPSSIKPQDSSSTIQSMEGKKGSFYSSGGSVLSRTAPLGRPNWTGPRPVNTRCFVCEGSSHIACNCPFKGRSAPVEARGSNNFSRSVRTTNANLQESRVNQPPEQVR